MPKRAVVIPDLEVRRSSRVLVLLLHAYTATPGRLKHVRQTTATALPDADILVPALPVSTFSTANLVQVASELVEAVDDCWSRRSKLGNGESYERIILVGHSIGGLLARKLYIFACGENQDAPFEEGVRAKEPRPWARCVERVILLAGMNRGWSISHHMSPSRALVMWLGAGIGNLMMLMRIGRPLVFSVRCGAPFLTQLRIQSLSMNWRAEEKGVGGATTVQLLGSIDDVVSPPNSVDLVTGGTFVYLDVPQSGHANVVEMDSTTAGRGRAAVFTQALVADQATLKKDSVTPADVGPPGPTVAGQATDVVFVIHGIRDQGFWTQKIGREVQRVGRANGRLFAMETSTYGYFPMLPFILPWKRRAKVQWLMDRYIENLARYGGHGRKVEFSYVGHSNGTYMLAQALKEYPACRFNNVVFAGSVVNTRYDWAAALRAGRIKGFLNYVATADWVVAIFPRAVQMVGLPELGGAGHDGFAGLTQSSLGQIEYVRGHHAAAIQEDNWRAIANFIVHGKSERTPQTLFGNRRSLLVVALGNVAPLLWVAILVGVLAGGGLIFKARMPQWAKTLSLVAYARAVWIVLTRV